jgi:serine/threonine protein kinase
MADDKARDNLLALLGLIEAQPPLQGRFGKLKRIDPNGGRGAFSLIFTAEDALTGKSVVVKAFPSPFVMDTYRWECFKRESEMLERLSGHDRIIQIVTPWTQLAVPLQYGMTIDIPYYTVERAEDDVESVVAYGLTNTEWALVTFKEMCKAVHHIHKMGIVHRDLKPGNFLLMKDGTLRLSDFGTARLLINDAKPILADYAGQPPGAIPYTSPEIVSSLHDVDATYAYKGDIFSLGAILFELVTGVVLGPQIYDLKYQRDLLEHMASVPRNLRKQVFDGFITELADKRTLPDIRAFGTPTRKCVIPTIDDLYKKAAALDYRKRTGTFEQIYLKIDQALLVLRNEDKYKRWREQRERYRRAAQAKRERTTARFAGGTGGTK